jgi:hypothetical protein
MAIVATPQSCISSEPKRKIGGPVSQFPLDRSAYQESLPVLGTSRFCYPVASTDFCATWKHRRPPVLRAMERI